MLTVEQLRELLRGVKKSTFVTLTAYTAVTRMFPELNGKTNPFYGRTWKRAQVNGGIYFWYQTAVNKRRAKEGKAEDFVALPHHYHVHIRGTPLVHHKYDKSRVYLPILVNEWLNYQYEVDGEVVTKRRIERWFRPEGLGRQGLDSPVIYREYLLTSITHIAIHGEWIPIDHPQTILIA